MLMIHLTIQLDVTCFEGFDSDNNASKVNGTEVDACADKVDDRNDRYGNDVRVLSNRGIDVQWSRCC